MYERIVEADRTAENTAAWAILPSKGSEPSDFRAPTTRAVVPCTRAVQVPVVVTELGTRTPSIYMRVDASPATDTSIEAAICTHLLRGID